MDADSERRRQVEFWDAQAAGFDERIAFLERRFLAGSRAWVGGRAAGTTLEVAIGTGLNLPSYPGTVRLTGIDQSAAMVEVARRRAAAAGRPVVLDVGDATALPYPEAAFDTVVCTFALCSIPDDRAALIEMLRVLRPGGSLLLADHVLSSTGAVRLLQRLVEVVTVPWHGEHFTRRPSSVLGDLGVAIVDSQRHSHGVIERLHAVKR